MISLNKYAGLITRLNQVCQKNIERCLVALLFADPGFELVQNELLPFLERFNARSGQRTNFFFAGFVVGPEASNQSDAIFIVQGANKLNWSFSVSAFEQIRQDFEKRTSWQYSGGIDLVLMDGCRDDHGSRSMRLQFDEVVTMNLLAGRENKTLPAISQLFEGIFRYSEDMSNDVTVSGFSDSRIPSLCRGAAEGTLKALLPGVSNAFQESTWYTVRSINR